MCSGVRSRSRESWCLPYAGFFPFGLFMETLIMIYCLLSTVYCLLSTVYFLLSTVYCLLSTIYCLLSTVYCLLSNVFCLLSENLQYLQCTKGLQMAHVDQCSALIALSLKKGQSLIRSNNPIPKEEGRMSECLFSFPIPLFSIPRCPGFLS